VQKVKAQYRGRVCPLARLSFPKLQRLLINYISCWEPILQMRRLFTFDLYRSIINLTLHGGQIVCRFLQRS